MAISKDKVKKAAAASYFTDPGAAAQSDIVEAQEQEPVKKKGSIKTLTSFFIKPEELEEVQLLSKFRSIATGKSISNGAIVRTALTEYLDGCREEIEEYRKIATQITGKK